MWAWIAISCLVAVFIIRGGRCKKIAKALLGKNFDSEELQEKSAVSILETTAKDNKVYKIKHFNLDAVLSVGYRVNS